MKSLNEIRDELCKQHYWTSFATGDERLAFESGFDACLSELQKRAPTDPSPTCYHTFHRLGGIEDCPDCQTYRTNAALIAARDEQIKELQAENEKLKLAYEDLYSMQANLLNGPTGKIVREGKELRQAAEKLASAAELGMSFAPKGEVPPGLSPMFYLTLNYEDEVKLQERIDAGRAAISEFRARFPKEGQE